MSSVTVGFIKQAEAQNCKITKVCVCDSVKNDKSAKGNTAKGNTDNSDTDNVTESKDEIVVSSSGSDAGNITKQSSKQSTKHNTKQKLMVGFKCSHGHKWEGTPQRASKNWCVPCSLISTLKEKHHVTATLLDNKWSYEDTHHIMTCEKGHKFTVDANLRANTYGCPVCNTLQSANSHFEGHDQSKQFSCDGNIVCGHRKSILEWCCNTCNNTFCASPETLTKHVGIKRCPHSIKFGGVHSNTIICKNIVESVFMLPFNDDGTKYFGKRGPTVYNAKLNMAVHYTDPKETAWSNTVVRVCREQDIKLIKINHTKWTQESLLRHVLEKLTSYVHIPDFQFMVDEIMPNMFLTTPAYVLRQHSKYSITPIEKITINAPLSSSINNLTSESADKSTTKPINKPTDKFVSGYAGASAAPHTDVAPHADVKLDTTADSSLSWKDPASAITYDLPFYLNTTGDRGQEAHNFMPMATLPPVRKSGNDDSGEDSSNESSDDCDDGYGDGYDNDYDPFTTYRPQSVADLMTHYLFEDE